VGEDRFLLAVFPAQVLTATVRAAGRDYTVSFADGDCDGSSCTVFSPGGGSPCDRMGVDLDGDGELAAEGAGSHEVMPVPKILRVADRWYAVEADEAADAVVVEEVEPEFGSLDVGMQQVRLVLWSDTGVYTLAGSDAPWRLPAGRYSARAILLAATDETGAEWTLAGGRDAGRLADFVIDPGATTAFQMGPPLSDDIGIRIAGGSATIVLSLVGSAGERYAAVAQRSGLDLPRPGLRVEDEAGGELLAGEFSVDAVGQAVYRWVMPEGLDRRFFVEASPFLGPFRFERTGGWGEPPAAASPPPPDARIPKAPGPIVVDADVSDWEGIPRMPANQAAEGPHWMKLCWQEEGIYGAARVADDDIEPNPTNPYLGDCIKVRLELDAARSPFYTENCRELALGPAPFAGRGGAHILLKNLGAGSRERSVGEHLATGLLAEWAPDKGGYVIEFFIPAGALFPADVEAGTMLGLAWNLIDGQETVHRATPSTARWWRYPSTWPAVEFGE
jgi:hypothetical protein